LEVNFDIQTRSWHIISGNHRDSGSRFALNTEPARLYIMHYTEKPLNNPKNTDASAAIFVDTPLTSVHAKLYLHIAHFGVTDASVSGTRSFDFVMNLGCPCDKPSKKKKKSYTHEVNLS
jgi:hypothetical protein